MRTIWRTEQVETVNKELAGMGASPPRIAVVGPTATGKTEIGILVAEMLGGEIISADSMQIWCEMDIGTAKPSPEDRERAEFHLVDFQDWREPFSVAAFQQLARQAEDDIIARSRVPLLVGGTGLYVRAAVDQLTFPPMASPELRNRLSEEAALRGTDKLWERLAAVDARTAARLSPSDGRRIIRALEVFETTGRTLTSFLEKDAQGRGETGWTIWGLHCRPEVLVQRIDERVDRMVEAGLPDEVRGLWTRGMHPRLQSAQALGYKEMLRYVAGEVTLGEAVQEIKLRTRQFAKRQRTWFRPDPRVRWLDVTEEPAPETASRIVSSISSAR